LLQHGCRVEPVRAGNRLRLITTDAVGRFAEEAETRTGDLRQLLRQRVQLGRARMLYGAVAEEETNVLAGSEALCDSARRVAHLDGCDLGGHCGAFDFRSRFH